MIRIFDKKKLRKCNPLNIATPLTFYSEIRMHLAKHTSNIALISALVNKFSECVDISLAPKNHLREILLDIV